MKREPYLADREVQSFLSWARPFVTGDRALIREWNGRWGAFRCRSLFEAYQAFDWPFRVQLPDDSSKSCGRSLDDNFAVLGRLSCLLRQAADEGNAQAFLTAAIAVVEWGGAGVRRNRVRLATLGSDALTVVLADAARLDPTRADLSQLGKVNYLNSGFSKIHALLIDDYPIYDSRVACALASLVRRYCEESGRTAVPQQQLATDPRPVGSAKLAGFAAVWRVRPVGFESSTRFTKTSSG